MIRTLMNDLPASNPFRPLFASFMILFGGLALTPAAAQAASYQEIEWVDLIPDDDLEALENRPAFIDQIEEGSGNDILAMEGGMIPGLSMEQSAEWQRYQAALTSVRTRPEFDGRQIRIAGFIVPLVFDDDQNVSEFFFVPFFGACIHVPPPPPNQMIHVTLKEPYPVESILDPFWLNGTLKIESMTNDIGTSSYSLLTDSMTLYSE